MPDVWNKLAASTAVTGAAAFGFVIAHFLPGLGTGIAGAVAAGALSAVVLLAGLLRGETRRLGVEVETLRNALRQLNSAFGEGRDEAWALREAIARGRAAGDRRVSRVIAEVRVLEGLIKRLSRLPTTAAVVALRDVMKPAEEAPEALPPAEAPVAAPEVEAKPNPLIETLRDALRLDRVDIYLQPIVSLPQRKPRFYECFSRIRAEDGTAILPESYIDLAASEGLVGTIDNILLFRCTQLVRRTRSRNFETAFFCNLAAHSLDDMEFFNTFIDFMKENAALATGLIFELHQSEAEAVFRDHRAEMVRLSQQGVRFSLDRVSDLNLDVKTLAGRNFRFVKIEAERLTPHPDVAALKASLDDYGIDLIVEKIEQEKDLIELLDHGIDYGQGYLFGEPRLSRVEGEGVSRTAAAV